MRVDRVKVFLDADHVEAGEREPDGEAARSCGPSFLPAFLAAGTAELPLVVFVARVAVVIMTN